MQAENDDDEPAPSEDGKRKSSPDVESEIPAKKAKLDTETKTSRKSSLPTPAVSEQPEAKTDKEEEAMKVCSSFHLPRCQLTDQVERVRIKCFN